MNNKRIWITWESQRRNKSLSKKLNAKYFEILTNKPWFIRYPVNLLKTLFIYRREQPHLIFVQNPSIVLALFSVLYGKFFNVPVVVDAHNAGVYPLEGASTCFNKIAIYIFRKASLTLVTNASLSEYVHENGGSAFVLPDPLPEFPVPKKITQNNSTYSVLFICTWAADEPYLEVIKSAQNLDDSITIHITGKVREKELQKIQSLVARNINFTGFLPDEDYIALLYSSDIIIDLTTRENCLVCGAYEAVTSETPLILSDKRILREYFYKGVVFTDNNYIDISNNINYAINNHARLSQEIQQLKSELIEQWKTKLIALEIDLNKVL